MHLFLSPHLDDAVLSCGAMIKRLAANGQDVLIMTVTAGDAPELPNATPIVHDLHQRWGLGANPVPGRRREDSAAAQLLGARVLHLPFLDCIYRRDAAGHLMYSTDQAIFGDIDEDDGQANALAQYKLDIGAAPDAEITLYIPLGVGHHVDHQIARAWGLKLRATHPRWQVRFYEDYPYCRVDGATERALEYFMWNEMRLEMQILWVSEAEVAAKIDAIACYASQISTFWHENNRESLAADVRATMLRAGQQVLAERLWVMTD
ncbi:MAG: PIG-L family deacetylase [Chloroflexi bacterium]|nr:PIG-L family deacetylase [Chloroflexota bacterium]